MTDLYLHLLINEKAGSGSGKKAAEQIKNYLTTHNISYDTYTSNYHGHAIKIAEKLLATTLRSWNSSLTEESETYPLLVVLGGDGTLHEVINALGDHSDIPIGYIPCGSGNDFARGVNLERKPTEALEHLLRIKEPDFYNTLCYKDNNTGDINYCSNNIGIGVDANIVATANHSTAKKQLNKLKLGSLSYLTAATSVVFKQKGFPLTLITDDETTEFKNTFLCTTTNHPYFGGGVALAPLADPKKEDMTIMIVERIAFPKLARLITQLLRRKHLSSKYLHQFHTTEARLISKTLQYGQVDGEEMGYQPFDITFTTQKRLFWL